MSRRLSRTVGITDHRVTGPIIGQSDSSPTWQPQAGPGFMLPPGRTGNRTVHGDPARCAAVGGSEPRRACHSAGVRRTVCRCLSLGMP